MLVLASSSPRRSELLRMAGYEFTAAAPKVKEDFPHGTPPIQAVEQLALRKAHAAALEHPGQTILAADTLVVLKNRILGKPKTTEDAKAMLKLLSGAVHQVYTGYCILRGKDVITGHECTSVEFYPLRDTEIDDYAATGEPMDKAGAYGIQGRGALLVKRIDGDFYNVMGLPIGKINRLLREPTGK